MALIELERVNGDYGFEAKDSSGHILRMDTKPEMGGQDFGVRPMQTLLMGLGGCSAIDIISILKKQRQEITGFKIYIDGERAAGKEPSIWETMHVVFKMSGNIDIDKAKKAADLSMEKYCSVAETLRLAGGKITWEVKINNNK